MNHISQRLTEADLEIGRIYYGMLIEQARGGQMVTYGDLVERAKARHPENEFVQRAIAVSAGRRLEAVRVFTNQRGYPDLTSLVVNASTGEVGSAFGTDPISRRAEVAVFDWSSIKEEFDLFLGEQHAVLPKKQKKVRAADARQMVWDFYAENKAVLPPRIVTSRDMLVKMVMDGHAVADAFEIIASSK